MKETMISRVEIPEQEHQLSSGGMNPAGTTELSSGGINPAGNPKCSHVMSSEYVPISELLK